MSAYTFLMRTRLTLLLALVAAWIVTPTASPMFHFELLKSSPTAKATLTSSPAHIQLWFSQVPAAGVSTISLSKDGKHVAMGKTTITAADKSMSADPANTLTPGNYVIQWRGAGDDGHVQQGTVAFAVAAKLP